MKKRNIYKTILLFFVIPISMFASFEKKESGAKEQSLGNAMVAETGNPFAIFYNPANISFINGINIYADYRNFYGMPGIYQADIVSNFSVINIPVSLAFSKYGNELYSEIQLSMGSNILINKAFTFGASLQLYSLSISNYGTSNTWGLNIGLRYNVIEKVNIGAHITNINNPTIGQNKEDLPQTFSLGVKYDIFPKSIILFELFRDIRYGQDYRCGVEYEIFNKSYLRIGVSDKTDTYSFGTGIEIDRFIVDYSLMVHNILGSSHSVTAGVCL